MACTLLSQHLSFTRSLNSSARVFAFEAKGRWFESSQADFL
jgi:hypothetical protein